MQEEQLEIELSKARKVFDEALIALETTFSNLSTDHKKIFPNDSFMLSSLYMSAMCCYIKDYLGTFSEDIQHMMFGLIAINLGFQIKDNEVDLAAMPVLGNA